MEDQEITFVPTNRGGQHLVHQNFKFRLNRRSPEGKRYWKCTLENCPAKAATDENDRLTKVTAHNHAPIPGKLAAEKICRGIKRRAAEGVDPVPRIYQDVVFNAANDGELNDATYAHLPNLKGIQSSAYRSRRKRLPLLPQSQEDIVLEGEWAETADGRDFVLANDGAADKLLIFGSIEGLSKIAHAGTLYMDGTFYSSPNLFAQLYTVHAKSYGQMFPLAYGLFPDRRQGTYERFLRLIGDAAVQNNLDFDPQTVMVDYEMGAIRAVESVLPNTQVKGCLFHYGQAINRCVQRIGLQAEYHDAQPDDRLKKWIRRTATLPLVPIDRVNDVWNETMNKCPEHSTSERIPRLRQ